MLFGVCGLERVVWEACGLTEREGREEGDGRGLSLGCVVFGGGGVEVGGEEGRGGGRDRLSGFICQTWIDEQNWHVCGIFLFITYGTKGEDGSSTTPKGRRRQARQHHPIAGREEGEKRRERGKTAPPTRREEERSTTPQDLRKAGPPQRRRVESTTTRKGRGR